LHYQKASENSKHTTWFYINTLKELIKKYGLKVIRTDYKNVGKYLNIMDSLFYRAGQPRFGKNNLDMF